MNNLAMSLVRLCKHNRDGSFSTQTGRRRGLVAAAKDLYALGYKLPKANSIKPKHIQKLVSYWQEKGLSNGTIKNRLGWLRWWAQKVNKANVMPRSNRELGVDDKTSQATSRAKSLSSQPQLRCERMQLALKFMAAFGLRFEEALKLRPQQADQSSQLKLQASWTKGGRARTIPIRTDEQRALLEQAKQLFGSGSFIPNKKSYITYRKRMEKALQRAGITNVHGLRHAYAQLRYQELTGCACPAAGGPEIQELTSHQRQQDRAARQIVSRELGHERLSITKAYLD